MVSAALRVGAVHICRTLTLWWSRRGGVCTNHQQTHIRSNISCSCRCKCLMCGAIQVRPPRSCPSVCDWSVMPWSQPAHPAKLTEGMHSTCALFTMLLQLCLTKCNCQEAATDLGCTEEHVTLLLH